MDRTYERKQREESRWTRFVAQQERERAQRLRAELRRTREEAEILLQSLGRASGR